MFSKQEKVYPRFDAHHVASSPADLCPQADLQDLLMYWRTGLIVGNKLFSLRCERRESFLQLSVKFIEIHDDDPQTAIFKLKLLAQHDECARP